METFFVGRRGWQQCAHASTGPGAKAGSALAGGHRSSLSVCMAEGYRPSAVPVSQAASLTSLDLSGVINDSFFASGGGSLYREDVQTIAQLTSLRELSLRHRGYTGAESDGHQGDGRC